jgi:hypothetical protein
MPARGLKIDQLDLDVQNPRIKRASSQHEVMQRLIDDQDVKLANLAESIVDQGLNPMDRLLVIKSPESAGRFVVLEGNRRALALKILNNPAVLTGLEVRSALQKRLERLSQLFEAKSVEPVASFEVPNRADGSTWIEQRHIGADAGRGIVGWSGVAAARFRGRDPALQALDFVRQYGALTGDQRKLLEGRFPITTLDRLLSTPTVRAKIGFEVKDEKLITSLPPREAIKPLSRIVLDLAEKKINVTRVKLKPQQLEYVDSLKPADRPDLSKKTIAPRPVDSFTEQDFLPHASRQPKKARTSPSVPRLTAIPKACRLNIGNAKIAELYGELKSLRIDKYPHSVAVLLRVFLETSVDHYLTSASIPLTVVVKGHIKDKSLKSKVEEAIKDMVSKGADKKDYDGVLRGIHDRSHPFHIDLLHAYVHNRFVSPTDRDLRVGWDNAQPFFERIWH